MRSVRVTSISFSFPPFDSLRSFRITKNRVRTAARVLELNANPFPWK